MLNSLTVDPLSLMAAVVLFFSILSLWSPWKEKLSLVLFAGFLLMAGLSGRIEAVGWLFALGFIVASYFYFKNRVRRIPKYCNALVILILGVLLGGHRLPGFHNWKIVSGALLAPDAIPYSLYFNFDKSIVGFVLLFWGISTCRSKEGWRKIGQTIKIIVPLTVVVVVSLAFLLGYIRFDPKAPMMTPLWILDNLFITCIAEEAFFRGFIQKKLVTSLTKFRWGTAGGLIIASVLFGLAHAPGGWKYVVLATVAGMFYGAAYAKSERIEASILTHFSLNLVHFLFFTYPALKTAVT